LKAVLFDLGETLIKTAPLPKVFQKILSAHGVRFSLDVDDSAFKVEDELTPEDYMLPYKEFWKTYNMKILKNLEVNGNLERLAEVLTEEWWDNAEVQLYPDVKETLSVLRKRGLKIGIVTNGFRKDIEEILSRTGLTGVFDITVGVDDVGKPKPHKEIFHHALKVLNIPAGQALFVGDNPEADYKGAQNAGLKALIIDRDDCVVGEFEKIQNLKALLQYL